MPLAAAGSGAAWARVAAVRAGDDRAGSTLLALLGGAAAAGLALAAYELSALLGLDLRWGAMVSGGSGALLTAAAVGLVEEGAKLAGILLVVPRGVRRATTFAAAAGVCAGFAALETVVTLGGAVSTEALARAAFGPVAHALLAAPLAVGVAVGPGAGRGRWLALPLALLASAALHALADLGVALPGAGRLAYVAALAVPAVALFLAARCARAAAAK